MSALVFIVAMIIVVFVVDIGKRWWLENEWRRRWRRTETDDD